MILRAYNPSTDNLEKSYLTQDYAAGVTAIKVRNNDSFAQDDRIMIGEMGRERTEIVTIGAAVTAGEDLTVGATLFPHSADDPVYVLKYDQVKFYRSTTTIDGSYGALATVALDVDNADDETHYDDTTGLSSYYYKVSYYHSIAGTESSLSDPMPGSGYTRDQLGSIANEFLTEVADLQQKYMTIPEIISLCNEVNDDLTSQSRKPYRFQHTSSTLSIAATTETVDLPADLLKFDYVRYNYNFTGTNRKDRIRVISMAQMDYLRYDQNALTDNDTLFIAIDDTTNKLVLYPIPTDAQSNVLQVFYWKKITDFDSLGDAILTPTPRVYKLFLLYKFYLARSVKENAFLAQAQEYKGDYGSEVVKLQRMNKLNVGSPTGFQPDTLTAKGLNKY